MVQSQFESAGINSGPSSAPDLSNHGPIKQMMIETHIKRNAQGPQHLSILDGLSRMGLVAGGGAKDATDRAIENFSTEIPDATIGVGMGFSLGAVPKSGKLGTPMCAIAGSIMTLNWAKNELNGTRWTGFGDALSDAYQSPANLLRTVPSSPPAQIRLIADREVASRSLGKFAVDTAAAVTDLGAGNTGGFGLEHKEWGSKTFESFKTANIEVASSLSITESTQGHQRFAVEPSLMSRSSNASISATRIVEGGSFADGDNIGDMFSKASKAVKSKKQYEGIDALTDLILESKIGKETKVVKTNAQDGTNVMKTDTAGDGMVATAPRPASSRAITDFTPPDELRSAEPHGRGRATEALAPTTDVVFNAEPASIVEAEAPAAQLKNASLKAELDEPAPATTVPKEAAPEASKPPADVNPAVTALAKRMESTFADAQKYAKAFEHQRTQRQAERDISDIQIGKRRFVTGEEKDAALEAARVKKAEADASLREGVPPRYAQTLKKLYDYTKSVETYYKVEPNAATREAVLREAVKKVEELMSPIDNIWNGIPGKTPDLARPGIRGKSERPIWPEERLPQIQQHLDAKINTVDNAQAQRIGAVKDNIAVKEVLRLHEAGELPKDGSVIFFTKEGTLLYQSELKVSQRSTQARAKDAASAEKHANNTPAFIDVSKIDRGLGPEGAGLWRFIGLEDRIIGAAILKPVMKDGKVVELPGARNGRGEPMLKKEVSVTIGEVPADVTTTMAYGHLLNTLRAKKVAIQRMAPDAVSQSDALVGQTGHFAPDAVLSKS